MIEIRPESQTDIFAINKVNIAAFGRENEARLVDLLRDNESLVLSMVAETNGSIVGHIAYSPIMINYSDGSQMSALALAPVAVLPEFQKLGIGIRLVQVSLDILKARGTSVVIVLGHPEYYPRFGFVPASRYNIKCPFEVPDDTFMLLELTGGILENKEGVVKYRPEFDQV
jgi:putative acetyltransferase